jgi:hypothetical protein
MIFKSSSNSALLIEFKRTLIVPITVFVLPVPGGPCIKVIPSFFND